MSMKTGDGFHDVSGILAPKSIAVIGASDRPGNFGGATIRHLIKFRFKGPVWPVNRSGADVAGMKALRAIAELPQPADLAIIATPADTLLETVRDCAARGIHSGVAFAGGLGEAGGAGAELQDALAALCRELGFSLCGPNCVGVINTALPVTATFATALDAIDRLEPGAISMVSQSGGIGTTTFSLGLQAGFNFRHLVSSGNEAVVDFSDYLMALACDDGTRVIAGYLEGIRDGRKFMRALAEARARGKPVVLVKAGATGAGARAAIAHTGALAGEDRVFDAVLHEFGIVRARSVKELVDIACLLAGTPAGRSFGPGIGIATFGGGNGVIAADQLNQHGLRTPPLSPAIAARLKPLLPSVATAANPIDLTPTTAFRDEFLSQLPAAFAVVGEEPAIDVLLLIVGTLASRAEAINAAIDRIAAASPKPVCVAWPFPPAGLIATLAARGIHCFEEVADAVRALSRLAVTKAAATRGPPPAGKALAFDWSGIADRSATPIVVAEHRCHAILKAAGIPVAPGAMTGDENAAVEAAAAIGYPVALKGISAAVTHRAAAGLVVLGVETEDAVRRAVRQLRAVARDKAVELDGIYVEKMEPGATELLVTAFRDPLFGTMISCGAGGVLTEMIDDVVIRRAPVGFEAAQAMLESLRLRRYARDAEGELPTAAPAAFLSAFSALAVTAPWKRFTLEANPVKWRRDDAVAVDGLLVIEAP